MTRTNYVFGDFLTSNPHTPSASCHKILHIKQTDYGRSKKFGIRLTKLRKARGWSQEKLTLESELARNYLSGVERRRRNISLINICKLADTLGVIPSELMNFEQEAASGTPQTESC